MRILDSQEINAVSGGTYCQPKPVCSPLYPVLYALDFLNGLGRLLLGKTEPRPCTPPPCQPSPCTPAGEIN